MVIRAAGGIVFLFPPGEDGAAVPGGSCGLGESPEEAAVRESREETGLAVEVVHALGTWFRRDHPYGGMHCFFFEAEAVGGYLRSGPEGRVEVRLPEQKPPIPAARQGSLHCWEAYRSASGTP